MAENYWFFNSAPGDERTYQAADFARYFGNVLSDGLLHTDNVPGLKVVATGVDLQTYVEPGKAIIDGYMYENTTDLYLTHSLPEPTLDRIDRIVLRLDKRNQSRFVKLFVKEGESAEVPVAPELQRDSFIHELSIAQVRVNANTSTINIADIFDERTDASVAGLVYSLISKPQLADIAKERYTLTSTEGQTDFIIPYETFSKENDSLDVFVDGVLIGESSYTVIHPRTVRFNVGLVAGKLVEFNVITGVIKLPTDYVVTAGEVGVTDAGGYYEEENVEGALQKIGLALFKPKPTIYGIEIDETLADTYEGVTYLDDAITLTQGFASWDEWENHFPFNQIKPCVVQPITNQFVSYLNPNNYEQKEDGTPIDISSLLVGDVFMEVPTIWWNIKRVGYKVQIRIAAEKVDDDWVALAHKKGNVILPKIYIGTYLGFNDVDNKLRSLSGKTPNVFPNTIPPSTFRGYATNNNVELTNYYQRYWLPFMLFMLKYKDRYSALTLGEGGTTLTTGATNTVGLDSINTVSTNDRTKFLGVEDVFAAGSVVPTEFVEGATVNYNTTTLSRALKIKTNNYSTTEVESLYDISEATSGIYTTTIESNGIGLIGRNSSGSSSTYYTNTTQVTTTANTIVGIGKITIGYLNLSVPTTDSFRTRIIYRPDTPIN